MKYRAPECMYTRSESYYNEVILRLPAHLLHQTLKFLILGMLKEINFRVFIIKLSISVVSENWVLVKFYFF